MKQLAKSKKIPVATLSFGLGTSDYHSGASQNNVSAGITITGPLYAGGNIEARITDAERKHNLSMLDLSRHQAQFQKKRENFVALEHSLFRSIKQAREQARRNEAEIQELIERGDAGFSVFADLSQRKLQRLELNAIVLDLEERAGLFLDQIFGRIFLNQSHSTSNQMHWLTSEIKQNLTGLIRSNRSRNNKQHITNFFNIICDGCLQQSHTQ